MRRCAGSCGLEKPEEAFTRRANGNVRKECKSCHAAATKAKRNERPERTTLTLMIQRCHNDKHPKFHHYGGRGIQVCDEWRAKGGFELFFAYMGPRPSAKHSIDRYPNRDGNYEPGNVRWATQSQQMSNTRNTRLITVNGRTQSLSEWERETGIKDLDYRLSRGESPEEAIGRPSRPLERLITVGGVTLNQVEWSLRLGGNATLVVDRLSRGWSEIQAVTLPIGQRRGAKGRAA